jgi:hypothetical protein
MDSSFDHFSAEDDDDEEEEKVERRKNQTKAEQSRDVRTLGR